MHGGMDSQTVIQKSFAAAIREYRACRRAQACELCQKILLLEPEHADALHLSGLIALDEKRPGAALELVQRAIELKSDAAKYFASLGLIHHELRQFPQAIQAYRQAIELEPDAPDVWYNLGISYRNNGQIEHALEAYRRAIEINPKFSQAFNNIGHALRQHGRLEEAIEAYSRALALQPDHIEARNNLGVTMKDLGRLDEALECFRQTLSFQPSSASAHSNLVYAVHFHPDFDAQSLFQEHHIWNERHAVPLSAHPKNHDNDFSPNRRLRVGYVSPDFREHCQALFTVPLFMHHDHTDFEIFVYSDVQPPDGVTRQLRKYADTWRDTVSMTDEQLATRIREDRIDVLVDLTLHMARNRLSVFARKPAPLQVTWLGYPSTTGLTAIDYRLSDPYLDPPGVDESCYAEKTFRLPDTFWCYDPRASEPAVNELPAARNGFVTFGCLNNFCKINPVISDLWSRVLKSVPGSKLRLLAPPGRCREDLIEFLDIEPQRIEFISFRPRAEYLKQYHEIDLCLDTFPYNGHTTSLDALWMGVPVVSLCGQTAVSRAGFSQMSNLGLTELVGQTSHEFVQIALSLANNLNRLRVLRSELRGQMKRSPLMDADRFARNIEQAYRTMWAGVCESRQKRLERARM
jgi:protein O-GlcNAc transferase